MNPTTAPAPEWTDRAYFENQRDQLALTLDAVELEWRLMLRMLRTRPLTGHVLRMRELSATRRVVGHQLEEAEAALAGVAP